LKTLRKSFCLFHPFLISPKTKSQKCSFEPSQEARPRATAEGNLKPDDLIAICRKRTTIDSSGKETVSRLTYFVVDSVEALSKFGTDAWERVCVMTTGQDSWIQMNKPPLVK
jgi:hypothetical protein